MLLEVHGTNAKLTSVNLAGNRDIKGEAARQLTVVERASSVEVLSRIPVKLLRDDSAILSLDLSHKVGSYWSRILFRKGVEEKFLLERSACLQSLVAIEKAEADADASH